MRLPWHLPLLAALLLPTSPAMAGLELLEARTRLSAQTVLLDLEIEFEDPAHQISRALLRGEVWLDIDITLMEKGRVFTYQPVGHIRILHRLSYDPQRNIYHLTRVNQQEQLEFTSLQVALAHLKNPASLPVTRLGWLRAETDRYRGEVQARLYANPMPMAPDLGTARSKPLDWQSQKIRWALP